MLKHKIDLRILASFLSQGVPVGRMLDWDTRDVESVSDSDINLSNVPLLHGLVSVKGLNGRIATTEKRAE